MWDGSFQEKPENEMLQSQWKGKHPIDLSSPRERLIRGFQIPQSPGYLGSHGDCTSCTNWLFLQTLKVPFAQRANSIKPTVEGKGDAWEMVCVWEQLRGGLTQSAPFHCALCHFVSLSKWEIVCASPPCYGWETIAGMDVPMCLLGGAMRQV